MAISKWAAAIAIASGGALVGLIGGFNIGPLTLVVTRSELMVLGGVCGILVAFGCCYLASEYAQARAKNRRQIATLQRLAAFASSTTRSPRRMPMAHDVHVTA